VLEVHVLRADGLRAADSNGKSDPYAKVSVGKKDVHKRQTKVLMAPRSPALARALTLAP
jgi:Ca2+-dependent lipid-binding protein|tara:strand:+ start:294 stop:470 length:177 start_codon:yes stop_codon:yes gene_type:complete